MNTRLTNSDAREGSTPEREALKAGAVRRRAARGVMAVTISGIGLRGIALIASVPLARLLSPHQFGLAAIGFTIVTFGAFLASGGLGASLMRRAETPSREDLGAVLGFQLFVATVFAGAVALAATQLGTAGAIAAVMALTLPIEMWRVPAVVLAERELRYRPIVLAQLGETLVYYTWAITAAALGMGVWAIATAALVRSICGGALLISLVPGAIVRPFVSLARIRHMFGFGMRFQAVGAVNLVRDQGLNVAVAAIAGVATLGVWTVAFRLVQATTLLFESLWRVSFPAMARLLETGEDPRPLLERGIALTGTAAGFLVAAMGGSATALVPVLFGERWSSAADVLPWAAVGIGLSGPLSACAAGYLYAVGDARTALRATVAHTVVWFAVALPLLSPIGIEALGVGWLLACVTDCAVFAPVLQRRTGMSVVAVAARPVIAATLSVVGGLVVIDRIGPTLAGLVAALALAEAFYTTAMWLTWRQPLIELIGLVRRTIGPSPAS
jgi:O-antigen/teichoic acid export membrane protein